jgi:hypothetical protein
MSHTVLHFVDESGLSYFSGFEIDFVLQCGVVTERNLFIEAFFADSVFPLEREKSVDGKC